MGRLTPLKILILILLILGIGIPVYKIKALGFSLNPEKKVSLWTVEAEITFEGDGQPVEVLLNVPDNFGRLRISSKTDITSGYQFNYETIDGIRRGVWRSENAQGPQRLYYRANVYLREDLGTQATAPPQLNNGTASFADVYLTAADALVAQLKNSTDSTLNFSQTLLKTLNTPEKNKHAKLLLEMPRETGGKLGLVRDLLLHAEIPARVARGVFLSAEKVKRKKAQGLVEVHDGQHWLLFNPKTAALVEPDSFLLWENNDESLLEVIGGSNSRLRFSTISSKVLANKAAISAGKNQQSPLIDFSIYSLPLAEQNTFKLLLLIPFGALVVVILRNLVGIRTSGTFMPILIALTFLQTKLLTGLLLFLVVVSVGLILRSFLSRMNLLLVPRISAVLVFVITIYLVLSVVSYKLGSDIGLQVTFFPMIIVSWTIERMSILWEEEGHKEVLIQGSGSLFTASLVYLLLINPYLGHLTYSFPELLLVLLALILMIGSYTGYRLTELRRFEPMVRGE